MLVVVHIDWSLQQLMLHLCSLEGFPTFCLQQVNLAADGVSQTASITDSSFLLFLCC